MIKTTLQGKQVSVSINAMIDSGVTEDLIDKTICDKHQITPALVEKP